MVSLSGDLTHILAARFGLVLFTLHHYVEVFNGDGEYYLGH